MGDVSLNSGMAQEKLLALARAKKQPVGPENALANQEIAKSGQERESTHQWGKVEEKGKKDVDYKVLFSATMETSTTTVLTPESVKALKAAQGFKQQLQQKFTGLFEQAYANCFHHNRLVAKVAEFTVGNVLSRLAMTGMSSTELAQMKQDIRVKLIDQNTTAFQQVVYDETMLEIVA